MLNLNKEILLNSLFLSNFTNLLYQKTHKKTFLILEKIDDISNIGEQDLKVIPFEYALGEEKNFLFFLFNEQDLTNLLAYLNLEKNIFFYLDAKGVQSFENRCF